MARPDSPRSFKRSLGKLRQLVTHNDESIAVLAASNLGVWSLAGGKELDTLQSKSASRAVKQALAIALATTSSERNAGRLALLAAGGDLETRYAAAAGLAQANLRQGVQAVVELLSTDPLGTDPVPLVKSILQQRDGGRMLGDALQGAKLHPAVVASISRLHRETGILPNRLADIFYPSTKPGSLSADLLKEDMVQLVADVEELGDPARGELIYRRSKVACMNCHAIGSVGPTIGPNLVAAGGAAKTKYFVQSILQPNEAIAEHYESRIFVLESGKTLVGIVAFRNEKEVVVRDSSKFGKEVRLDVKEIDEEIPSRSLMPDGLADQLRDRNEFLDLVKFISVLGKPGPYKNDESPVIRKWRVISGNENNVPADDAKWRSVYSKVSGQLPLADCSDAEYAFVRGYVNVLKAGSAGLQINSLDGLTLRLDGKLVDDLSAPIRLKKGRRTFTFGFNPKQRNMGLRVELKAVDNAAKFQPEGGL